MAGAFQMHQQYIPLSLGGLGAVIRDAQRASKPTNRLDPSAATRRAGDVQGIGEAADRRQPQPQGSTCAETIFECGFQVQTSEEWG